MAEVLPTTNETTFPLVTEGKRKCYIGKTFGMLTVVGVVSHGKYKCVCGCGRTLFVWSKFLLDGTRTNCGCVKFENKNLTGKRFGRWTVLGPLAGNRCSDWECKCECGTEKVVDSFSLKSGESKSCGCLQRETAREQGRNSVVDLIGKRFGRLVVLSRAGSKCKKALWACKCDCGGESVVYSRSLVGGKTKSCGCLQREVWHKLIWNPNLTDKDREDAKLRRVDPKNIEWRKAVYTRDNFVCQVCGDNNGGNLIAHHKDSWRANYSKRFEVENGATCCEKCHKEFHHTFGYGQNTPEEWKTFVGAKKKFVKMPDRVAKPRKYTNLAEQKFNRLTVIRADNSKKKPCWIYRCDCGTIRSVQVYSLVSGKTKSCGCLNKERIAIQGKKNGKDLSGKRFGKLTVKSRLSGQKWLCSCDCGTERIVWSSLFHNGRAIDCQSAKNHNKCSLRRVAA